MMEATCRFGEETPSHRVDCRHALPQDYFRVAVIQEDMRDMATPHQTG